MNYPSCIAELIYHDNKSDFEWYVNHLYDCGIAISKSVNLYFGLPYKEVEKGDMEVLVVYCGDFDMLSAMAVSQKLHCPVMKKSDYDLGKVKADKVIPIGGNPNTDRFGTFKEAANLL
jgi:hypothetical protein